MEAQEDRHGGLGNRTATTSGAELYRCWIANRRRLEQIIAQMEQISADAGEILLRQTTPPEPPRTVKR